jgi:hypothetical protein
MKQKNKKSILFIKVDFFKFKATRVKKLKIFPKKVPHLLIIIAFFAFFFLLDLKFVLHKERCVFLREIIYIKKKTVFFFHFYLITNNSTNY